MSRVLKPRRGSYSAMASEGKKDIILKSGELFMEYPDSGPGTGECKFKVGDGASSYESLPYALGDISSDSVTIFEDEQSTTLEEALALAESNNALSIVLGGLKNAVIIVENELTTLQNSFQDGCNTLVNWCISHGVTPDSNSINDLITAMNKVYNNAKGSRVSSNNLLRSSVDKSNSIVNEFTLNGKIKIDTSLASKLVITPKTGTIRVYELDEILYDSISTMTKITVKNSSYTIESIDGEVTGKYTLELRGNNK